MPSRQMSAPVDIDLFMQNKVELEFPDTDESFPFSDFLEYRKDFGEWMLSLELKDKNGKEICIGDIIEGTRGWMTGDGYKKKGYPDRVRVRLQVCLSNGRNGDAGYRLNEIGVHPEDRLAEGKYFYRNINYHLEEGRAVELKDNEVIWLGKNNSLEITLKSKSCEV